MRKVAPSTAAKEMRSEQLLKLPNDLSYQSHRKTALDSAVEQTEKSVGPIPL